MCSTDRKKNQFYVRFNYFDDITYIIETVKDIHVFNKTFMILKALYDI